MFNQKCIFLIKLFIVTSLAISAHFQPDPVMKMEYIKMLVGAIIGLFINNSDDKKEKALEDQEPEEPEEPRPDQIID